MKDTENQLLTWNLSEAPYFVLLLAHGAGSTMNQAFLQKLAVTFSAHAHVVRFNFPYIMEGRKTPGSPKSAISAIGKMVELAQKEYPDLPVFVSGKSYGGRMASHWVAENPDSNVKGLIYFGFPLHPPAKEGVDRAKHLPLIKAPQLFIQGTNDLLANLDLIKEVIEPLAGVTLEIVDGGDHSFKVPKKLGKTEADILNQITSATQNWVRKQI